MTPDSPATQQFFSLLHLSKNRYTQNNAGYGTNRIFKMAQSIKDTNKDDKGNLTISDEAKFMPRIKPP